MSWPEVVDTALTVIAVLGLVFFGVCLVHGWPGKKNGRKEDEIGD